MKKLKVYLENCYGINRLEHEFNFSEKRVYSIYASNGTMKSSFAKVFEDIIAEQESADLIYPDRKSVREITQDGGDINPQAVYVIKPYNDFNYEKAASLLLNKELREKYDNANKTIKEKKAELLEKLKKPSGIRSAEDIENTISQIFASKPGEFILAMETAGVQVRGKPAGFGDIAYTAVFSDKTENFLNTADAQKNISEYIDKYESLIDESRYFTKGIFNDYNAETIAKQLKTNGFFTARHHVVLRDKREDTQEEIKTLEALTQAITQEKEEIWENPDLISKFDKFSGKMTKNADLRGFRDYLSDNRKIIPELAHQEFFKKILFVSYMQDNEDAYVSFMEAYREQEATIEEIKKMAKEDDRKWTRVINTYNQRFSVVPVKVRIENVSEVALGVATAPKIGFSIGEEGHETAVRRDVLMKTLSTGEKKAMYILDIIFEIEDRKSKGQDTVFIIDDIADSFDYKNKYAILEYLRDISQNPLFCQIILTHNFDFHRTVSNRLDMVRENKKNVVKSDKEILINQETYQKNPFSHWVKNLAENDAQLIAAIPFARNIADFSGKDKVFSEFTKYLHIKEDSLDLTVCDLMKLFKEVFPGVENFSKDREKVKVFNLIGEIANNICDCDNQIELEHKVTLAVAIRLCAEKFIVGKIGKKKFDENQTYFLTDAYRKKYPDSPNIPILERVNLMTPENIHLNSFMYEPLLDMGAEHLKDLYRDVCRMKSGS